MFEEVDYFGSPFDKLTFAWDKSVGRTRFNLCDDHKNVGEPIASGFISETVTPLFDSVCHEHSIEVRLFFTSLKKNKQINEQRTQELTSWKTKTEAKLIHKAKLNLQTGTR